MLDIKTVREAIDYELDHLTKMAAEDLGDFEDQLPMTILVGVTKDPQDSSPFQEAPSSDAPPWAGELQFIPVFQRYEGVPGIWELVNRARALAIAGECLCTITCVVTAVVVEEPPDPSRMPTEAEMEERRAAIAAIGLDKHPARREMFIAFVEYAGHFPEGKTPEFYSFNVERDQGQCTITRSHEVSVAIPVQGAPRIIRPVDEVVPPDMLAAAQHISQHVLQDIMNARDPGAWIEQPHVTPENAS